MKKNRTKNSKKEMSLDKNQIAMRIAQELKDKMYVNLGIGIPTLVANYILKVFQLNFSQKMEFLGMGPFPFEGEEDADFINAGNKQLPLYQELCCLIRQHHLQ